MTGPTGARFLVVGCTRCGTPRVAERDKATAQCPRCGGRFKLGQAIVHARCETAVQARDAVGQVNAQKAGGELVRVDGPSGDTGPGSRDVEPADALDVAIGAARGARNEVTRARLAAEGLTRAFEHFTEEQWFEAMDRLDVGRVRGLEHLEKLQGINAVAEPRPGEYRFVA